MNLRVVSSTMCFVHPLLSVNNEYNENNLVVSSSKKLIVRVRGSKALIVKDALGRCSPRNPHLSLTGRFTQTVFFCVIKSIEDRPKSHPFLLDSAKLDDPKRGNFSKMIKNILRFKRRMRIPAMEPSTRRRFDLNNKADAGRCQRESSSLELQRVRRSCLLQSGKYRIPLRSRRHLRRNERSCWRKAVVVSVDDGASPRWLTLRSRKSND